ncbi:MAG TPA: CcmD family protein [Nitrospirae bacterium]|nr:CcmD family protein [Nitrospirota bacterium]
MKNLVFLVAAYMAVWAGVFSYLAYVAGQQRRLVRRLSRLEERLKEKDMVEEVT